ncbi:MAG TPA: hypothetical protein VK179_05330 [Bacteroidales bacterium]|nr:hypothetical protein [Bacteroidales bacterium]
MATTTKAQPKSKQANTNKNQDSGNSLNKSNRPANKKTPSEEEIREKAQQIYNERMVRGEYGTELDDWQRAEEILMNGK